LYIYDWQREKNPTKNREKISAAAVFSGLLRPFVARNDEAASRVIARAQPVAIQRCCRCCVICRGAIYRARLSPPHLRGHTDSLHSFCPKPQKESKSLFRLAPPAGVSARTAKSNTLALLKQHLIFNATLRLALHPPA
jgi:hypothetical protein